MSQNTSKAEKSDSHYKKSSRSGNSSNQKAYTGGGGKGGGGNAAPHPQSSSINPSSSSSSANRSSYRRATNGQGGQFRGNNSEPNVAAARPGQNGSHFQQPPLSGGGVSEGRGAGKPANVPAPRSNRPVPKVPPSQTTPDSMPPTTPAKGDGPKGSGFTFQFGTLSPGFVNGMQIPARTSSAPPNLDEQKRDQARHDSFRAMPTKPIPSAPKQQQPLVKEAVNINQPNSGESHAAPHVKKDHHPQTPTAPATTITQKPSVLPLTGMSMPMPFPSQVPVPFGGPNSQIQSQGMAATSMQMAMQLPAGSTAQMQQQVYVPSLQSHPLQTAGMVPQGQGLNFPPPQMGHQLPPMGNMGIGIASTFAQQQAGKFGGTRKAVKITHPETHEELRLDGSSSGARTHPNVPPQSQAIPSFSPAHQINYYTSYNPPPFFLPPQSTVPIASTQMTTGPQASRYNYPGGQGSPSVTFKNPSLNPLPVSKIGPPPMHGTTEPLKLDHHHDAQPIVGSASSAPIQVTVKPVVSHGEKLGSSSLAMSSPASKGESPKSLKLHKDVDASSEEAASVAMNPEGRRKETVRRSESFKDHQKKPGRKDTRQSQSQQQEDAFDHAVTSKSSTSVMIPRDVVKHPEMQSPPAKALESSMLASSLRSQSSENDSSKDRDSVECKVSNASLGASRGVLGSAGDPLPDTCARPEVSEVASCVVRVDDDSSVPSSKYIPESEGTVTDNLDVSSHGNIDISGVQLDQKVTVEQGEIGLNEGVKQDGKNFERSTSTAGSVTILDSDLKEPSVIGLLEPELEKNERPVVSHGSEVDGMDDNSTRSPAISSDSVTAETTTSSYGSYANSHENKTGMMDASTNRSEQTDKEDVPKMSTGMSHQESSPGSTTLSDDAASKQELKVAEVVSSGQVTSSVSGSKDKPAETNRAKITISKGKKKRKDILKAADAAGSTADLYMAYKGPEEKQETTVSSGSIDNSPSVSVKHESAADAGKDVVAADEDGQSKAELDDWEDAADISTPKLKSSGSGKPSRVDEDGSMGKKYTRDFLLTLSEQCTELPANFEIGSDIADALLSVQVGTSHLVEPYPNTGRVIDRSVGGPRPERRGSGIVDDDKWSKSPGPFTPGRDPRLDIHGGPATGFRPGQGGNHGVLRNPRGQPSGQYVGGILSGPMQSVAQGGMHRGNSDADRWQRATVFQKGLIPYPQTPLQVMHKAERKYEVGKVSDQEEAKQRQLKAILNKLTPQNFEKLFEKVKEVNIDNAVTLIGVISQIFDKALTEPTFCEMYADFCLHLSGELPDFFEDNEKINFKRLLLNKCQEEFERGEREQAEADRAEEDGEIKCSDEEREEKRVQARRRMLGNIRLIGELYKKKMLTERIMHECIKKLLGQPQNPDEEDVEALCKLMSTIGEMIDHPKAKEHMDYYFDTMMKLSNNMKLSSRVRFMLKDSIDLRKNKWQQRRKVEGPKKIEEVHRDAAQERQAQTSRLARGPSISSSRRGQPTDFGPRGSSMMSSPNTQMGGLRGFPPQNRGFGGQDVRYEERHPYESRVLSVPLSQRPIDDDSITLGPQGGLARGMSVRGEPLIPGGPVVDMSRTPVDSRRIAAGPNGYNPSGEWTPYNTREDVLHRYSLERSMPVPSYDQVNSQDRNAHPGNRDMRNAERPFDRPMASPLPRVHGSSNASPAVHAVASEKVVSHQRLQEMSITTIREFYSAKDKEEVALCIKDLNSPGFYPTMVSLWVTDSFERKDIERDLLARLLVDLTKARDNLLNQVQLMKGFEFVLAGLEDAVNDAPKAAEFLGRIFAKVILENVVPLGDIGQLIHQGGEEPGRLLEVGLASEVLGSILEIIRSEKGESVLNEIRVNSNLQLEDFRPPDPIKSRKLEAFI